MFLLHNSHVTLMFVTVASFAASLFFQIQKQNVSFHSFCFDIRWYLASFTFTDGSCLVLCFDSHWYFTTFLLSERIGIALRFDLP